MNLYTYLRNLFFLVNFMSSHSLNACFTGCVIDECSGEPLTNYRLTHYDPNGDNGNGQFTGFNTDGNGCFNYTGEEGTSIIVAGVLYTYTGGPCLDIGTVEAYGIGGGVLSNSTLLFTGSLFDGAINGTQIHGCEDNYLGLSSISNDISIKDYCVRVEIYRKNLPEYTLVGTLDWTPLYAVDGSRLINISSIMEDFPRDIYRLEVFIKCCDDLSEQEYIIGHNNVFGGFVWNPNLALSDIEFSWIGSSYTESYNNDGDPNNNQHPNDGNVWFLGQFTAGINGNIVPGSGDVSEVVLSIFKIDDATGNCSGNEVLIYQQSQAPTNNGSIFSNFIFNSATNGYFFNANDYVPGETCFKLKLLVKLNNPSEAFCPPTVKEAFFRIAPDNIFGITDNTSSDGILGQNALADAIVKESYDSYPDTELTTSKFNSTLEVYPNPATDIISIEGIGEVDLDIINISGQVYKVKSRDDKVDISALADGIYILQIRDKTGAVVSKRLVKQR